MTEKRLKQTLNLLAASLAAAADGLLVVDLDGRVLTYNRRFSQMWNIPISVLERSDNKQLIDFVLNQLSNPEDFLRRIQLLNSQAEAESCELLEFKDGKIFERYSLPLRISGKNEGRVWSFRDVTEKKKIERFLKESEERYRTIFESAATGIVNLSRDGRFLHVNPAFCNYLGYSKNELLKMNILDVTHPEDYEATRRSLQTSKHGQRVEMEKRYVRKDGLMMWVRVSAAWVYNSENHCEYSVAIIQDITERKRMEEELIKAMKIESLSLLAGGIAHDFNNILTVILGKISLAKAMVGNESPLFEKLEDAVKATERAGKISNQLLTFAKGGSPVKATSSIAELLVEAANFSTSGANVKCEFSIDHDLKPVAIDAGQIGQVIQNMVINARQAMTAGGVIRISASNVSNEDHKISTLKRGDYVKVTISDNGIGIPKKNLERIFDPFFTTKPEGSGLGLATAYSIIKKHEGTITVKSEPRKGTEFSFYLVACSGESYLRQQTQKEIVKGSGRVIVMDDDEEVLKIAGEILSYLGYEVEPVRDGKEAIHKYREAKEKGLPFRAVILDLTVPAGMGGFDTLQELKAFDPEVRAIVSSGYSNESVMADYLKYGFQGVIPKPYQIEEVSQTLHRVLYAK